MGLTAKQEEFCKQVVNGNTLVDAYTIAYNSKDGYQTKANEASKLMARDDIQAYLDILKKPLVKTIQTQQITEREKKRTIIWDRIESCIQSGDDAAIARYMDILNKMDAEYININKNIEDKSAEIKQLDTNTLLKLADIS